MMSKIVKNGTFTGKRGKNHIQGMAVDEKNDRIYYSFTTKLVATKLDGTPVGSADGLLGHLGCICFNPVDGLVYGSLEYKHDAIGRGIAERLGTNADFTDGFYIAVFDGNKITREDMDAAADGIMTAAFLPDVLDDYSSRGAYLRPHRYGCSGIDGTTIAPEPGKPDGKKYLYVAYGIYGDTARRDDDCQVLLRYDIADIKKAAKKLSQTDMHRSNPGKPLSKYFVFTGNTEWGVQNLSWDEKEKLMFMAVYRGHKKQYSNHGMYAADMTKAPVKAKIPGLRETGEFLTLCKIPGLDSDKTPGWDFDLGQYGMPCFPDGSFLIAQPGRDEEGDFGYVYNYRFSLKDGFTKDE